MGLPGRQRELVSARCAPERGDILWLTFDPQAGHEQAGRRPALVLSPAAYWAARSAQFVAKVSADVLADVTAKLRPLIGL